MRLTAKWGVVGGAVIAASSCTAVEASPDPLWLEVPDNVFQDAPHLVSSQWSVLENYELLGYADRQTVDPEGPADESKHIESAVWLGDGAAAALAETYSTVQLEEVPEFLPTWEALPPPDLASSDALVEAFTEGWEDSVAVYLSEATDIVFIITENVDDGTPPVRN